eukprot:4005229-Prymnesium_polylepis.1
MQERRRHPGTNPCALGRCALSERDLNPRRRLGAGFAACRVNVSGPDGRRLNATMKADRTVTGESCGTWDRSVQR